MSIALTRTNVWTNCLKRSCKIKWDACEYCKMHVNAWELYNKCKNLYIIEWCIRVTLELDSFFFSLFYTLHLSLPGYTYYHHTLHISGGYSLFWYVIVFQLIFQWSNSCGSCKLDPFYYLSQTLKDSSLIWMKVFMEIVVIFIWSLCCYLCLFRIIIVLSIKENIVWKEPMMRLK